MKKVSLCAFVLLISVFAVSCSAGSGSKDLFSRFHNHELRMLMPIEEVEKMEVIAPTQVDMTNANRKDMYIKSGEVTLFGYEKIQFFVQYQFREGILRSIEYISFQDDVTEDDFYELYDSMNKMFGEGNGLEQQETDNYFSWSAGWPMGDEEHHYACSISWRSTELIVSASVEDVLELPDIDEEIQKAESLFEEIDRIASAAGQTSSNSN